MYVYIVVRVLVAKARFMKIKKMPYLYALLLHTYNAKGGYYVVAKSPCLHDGSVKAHSDCGYEPHARDRASQFGFLRSTLILSSSLLSKQRGLGAYMIFSKAGLFIGLPEWPQNLR